MTWQTEHFQQEEFDSPDLAGSGELMDRDLIDKLEELRTRCGFPFIVTSGYRTPSYNATVPGASRNSAHTRGLAVDISIIDSNQRFMIVFHAIHIGFNRIEIGTKRDIKLWVHLDIDPSLPQNMLF
jgi:hypothetical protein